jgi:hypothetical protein
MISKASLISFRNLDLAWSRITTAKNLQHKRCRVPAFRLRREECGGAATLGLGAILASLGVDPSRSTELNWTENVKVGSLTVSALPARHFSGRSLFSRFETLWHPSLSPA